MDFQYTPGKIETVGPLALLMQLTKILMEDDRLCAYFLQDAILLKGHIEPLILQTVSL